MCYFSLEVLWLDHLPGYAENSCFPTVTSIKAELNIFKKTPYFPILLQFSELLVEDFGFIASSPDLGIDEGKVLGHLIMLWRLFFFLNSPGHLFCVMETEFSASRKRNF
jgi:hypothetical protein